MTIAEIAEAVGRSKATVRHWLRRYGTEDSERRRHQAQLLAEAAREAGRADRRS